VCEILERIAALHRRALAAAANTTNMERVQALQLFATNLEKAFYSFEPDFFASALLNFACSEFRYQNRRRLPERGLIR